MQVNQITTAADWIKFAMTHGAGTMDQVYNAGDATEEAFKSAISSLPRFSSDGNIADTVLVYVGIEQGRYRNRPDEMSLILYFYSPALQAGDFWDSGLSDTFVQAGNYAGKTEQQATMEKLKRIGFDYAQHQSFDGLLALIGRNFPVWVKSHEYNGKTYYNIAAIGGSEVRPPVKLRGFKLGATAAPSFAPQPQQQPAPTQQQQGGGYQPAPEQQRWQQQQQQAAPAQQPAPQSTPQQAFPMPSGSPPPQQQAAPPPQQGNWQPNPWQSGGGN